MHIYVWIWVWICMCVCRCQLRPEVSDSLGVGVIDNCELPNMDAGNPVLMLYKSSLDLELLSCLSRPSNKF